jgi:putative redox protein
MVKIQIHYQGNLHTEATHTPSGVQLNTDAPVDNGGKGESFSPTDLVATALGSCMATVMGIFAKRHEIDLTGMQIEVLKEMVQQPVRRIGKLTVHIQVPLSESHPHRSALEKAALTCPVHQSLLPTIEIPVRFSWES